MKHMRPRRDVVEETVDLARQLPAQQQRQAIASLIGLGHRFLTAIELDTLLEGLMSTTLGQQLIERGQQQGIEIVQETLVQILSKQFGSVAPSVGERLAHVNDLQRLRELRDVALSADSLDDFMRALGQ